MTAQSGRGQGDKPLYEGVVLPANGEPWTPEQQRQVSQPQTQPPAGQPWGEPWGPQSQPAPAFPEHSAPEHSAELPPPPPHAPAEPPAVTPPQYALPESPAGTGPAPRGRHRGGAPEPSQGTFSQKMPPPGAPQSGQALYDNAQLPPQPPQPPQPPPQAPPQPYTAAQAPSSAQPFAGEADATQMLPPQQGLPAQAYAGAQPPQTPPVSANDATQYIPPVSDGPQPGPHSVPQPGPLPPAGDADATQMLPPQSGAAQDPEATTMLRSPLPPERRGAAGAYGAGQGDGQQRQPPAEFDSLFRAEPAPPAAARADEPGSTQSLPVFDGAVARQSPNARNGGAGSGPYEPQGRAARRNAERGVASRLSPAVLIAIGVVLIAGIGMAAGAALSGGDEGEKAKSEASAPKTGEKKSSAAVDPAEKQAEELDKLLADSNNSRTAVIRSVENIKACKKLGKAAADLRAAAQQRDGLVTRLGDLETDALPASTKLRSALTRAWKSSAAADNHYAAWADQTAGKKGCRKGKARVTSHTGLGTRASGEATTAKREAAGLWNPTAKKYGLQEREFGQL